MSIGAREMRDELARQIGAAGGLRPWCRAKGISHAPVALMISGQRQISEAVANACGFICETTYKPLRRREAGNASSI